MFVHHCHANVIRRSQTGRQLKVLSPEVEVWAALWANQQLIQQQHQVWMPSNTPLHSRLRFHIGFKFCVSRPDLNLSWFLNWNQDQTIGCQQQDMAYSSADLRKLLSVNNSPLLGRNTAGTMEECEFPCFSIKPSARRKGKQHFKRLIKSRSDQLWLLLYIY